MLTAEYFTARRDGMVSLLRSLVEMETPTSEKQALDRLGDWVTARLEQLGANVDVDVQPQAGNHRIARWPGKGEEILTLCHMDTVFPLGTLASFPVKEQDGRLHGPGVVDMKAGIALLITVLSAFRDTGQWPARPITALFTTDEETGSHTSRPLVESLSKKAMVTFCLEPAMPNGALKTFRKGVGSFKLLARGRSAHAGNAPEQGRNAIQELAYHILSIQKLTDFERGTTLNVGVVKGGTASNVVPEEAQADVDLRVTSASEADRIIQWLGSLQPVMEGTDIEVTGGLNRPPMPRDETMIAAFQKAQTIAASFGMELREGGSGGGSDANFVSALGRPVLDGLGGLGDGLHSNREYVDIHSLPARAALLAGLLLDW